MFGKIEEVMHRQNTDTQILIINTENNLNN